MERTVVAVSSIAEASAFEGTDQSATRRKPKPQMDQPYKPPQRRNEARASDNKTNSTAASTSSGETPGARAERVARGVPTPQRLFADSPSFNPGGQEARQPRNADGPQQRRQLLEQLDKLSGTSMSEAAPRYFELLEQLELQRQQQQQQQGLEEQLDKLSLSGGPRDARQHGRHSGGNSRREGANTRSENKSSHGRKPKNTECFDPDARTDMRMVFGRSNKKNLREDRGEYHVKDVVMVPSLFCEEEDMDVYNALLAELRTACPEGGPEAGLSLAKGRDGLWATWHGDTHVIADDKKMGGKWKALSPSFAKVVDRMAEYFDMDVKATRLNWYRPGSQDWKPYHHDRAAFTPNCPQNITVAASFGASRDIGFQHAKTHSVMTLPQPNGSCYAFGRDVNIEWMHGVLPLRKGETRDTGRISIIAWGWMDMAEGNC